MKDVIHFKSQHERLLYLKGQFEEIVPVKAKKATKKTEKKAEKKEAEKKPAKKSSKKKEKKDEVQAE